MKLIYQYWRPTSFVCFLFFLSCWTFVFASKFHWGHFTKQPQKHDDRYLVHLHDLTLDLHSEKSSVLKDYRKGHFENKGWKEKVQLLVHLTNIKHLSQLLTVCQVERAQYIPENSYAILCPIQSIPTLASLSFVDYLDYFRPEYKISTESKKGAKKNGKITYLLTLLPGSVSSKSDLNQIVVAIKKDPHFLASSIVEKNEDYIKVAVSPRYSKDLVQALSNYEFLHLIEIDKSATHKTIILPKDTHFNSSLHVINSFTGINKYKKNPIYSPKQLSVHQKMNQTNESIVKKTIFKGRNSTCPNNEGTKSRTCDNRYITTINYENPSNLNCKSANCSLENGGCSTFAVCKQMVGQVSCQCKEGFFGDGFVCTNNSECINTLNQDKKEFCLVNPFDKRTCSSKDNNTCKKKKTSKSKLFGLLFL